MTAKQVINSGNEGWYWWRFNARWPWRPVEVTVKKGVWRADATLMRCEENPKLEKGGEYLGPIEIPDDSV